jgi:hypothetical protein
MSASSFAFASSSVPTSMVSRGRSRALAAIVFLIALGILTASSLLAAGDDGSLARARGYAPPASHAGPIDPHC